MDTSTGADGHTDGDGDATAQGGSNDDINGEQSSTETLDSDASRVADISIIGSIVRGDSDTASKEAHQTTGGEGASSTRPSMAGKGDHLGEAEGHSVLTGGLAVAVAGHWRAAEMQFEETARQVRQASKIASKRKFSRVLTLLFTPRLQHMPREKDFITM